MLIETDALDAHELDAFVGELRLARERYQIENGSRPVNRSSAEDKTAASVAGPLRRLPFENRARELGHRNPGREAPRGDMRKLNRTSIMRVRALITSKSPSPSRQTAVE